MKKKICVDKNLELRIHSNISKARFENGNAKRFPLNAQKWEMQTRLECHSSMRDIIDSNGICTLYGGDVKDKSLSGKTSKEMFQNMCKKRSFFQEKSFQS